MIARFHWNDRARSGDREFLFSLGAVKGECLMVVGRGSWVQSRGSWVGRGSWVPSRGSLLIIINDY